MGGGFSVHMQVLCGSDCKKVGTDRGVVAIVLAIIIVLVIVIVGYRLLESGYQEAMTYGGSEGGRVKEHGRNALCELFVSTDCGACPSAENTLSQMVDDEPLALVTMVIDKNEDAYRRALDYGIMYTPTAEFDFGYREIVGSRDESTYENAINACLQRNAPNVSVVNGAVKVDKDWINVTATIKNGENETFDGGFIIYIVAVHTEYTNSFGDTVVVPYAFLGYANKSSISLGARDALAINGRWHGSHSEDIAAIIAVHDGKNSITARIIYP
ncbi:MAG: hypothetical protein DRN20_00240, partial [Thermoplasmata archaeon]